jgi:gliding motility-associated-like protein
MKGFSTIRVVDRPGVSLRTDTVLCYGDTLLLQPEVKDVLTYKWSTGAATPGIAVTEKGKYTLQVANTCGNNSASVNIGFVRCSENLLVPSAFTPNKDGLNDVFRPVTDASIKQYNLNIYNRWGQVMFTSNNMSRGWDGTVNRIQQSIGGYVWVIEYTSKTGKHYSIHGTVTLIR